MKLPIPNDWNETDWNNFCIQWPDSVQFYALLTGFLSYLTRGRVWDEKTGSVRHAQSIGRDIFYKNIDPQPCLEGCEDIAKQLLWELWVTIGEWLGCDIIIPFPPPKTTVENLAKYFNECLYSKMENYCSEEFEDMPSVTNIKCEGGKLYMERCCQWIEVCDISSLTGNEVPDNIEPPSPPPDDPVCFKAGAWAKHFSSWIPAVYTNITNATGEETSVVRDYLIAAYPQNQWQWYPTIQMIELTWDYPGEILTMVLDSEREQKLKCAIYELLLEKASPESNASWLLTLEDGQLIQSWLGAYTSYSNVIKSWLTKYASSINMTYARTAIATYDPSSFDCSACSSSPLSPTSDVTPSGWFLTEGYSGTGSQSASGNGYNRVCLFLGEFPYNCWGMAFTLVSTNTELSAGSSGEGACNDGGSGPSTVGGLSTPGEHYIICNANIWTELQSVSDISYVQKNDGHYSSDNVLLPDDVAGGNSHIDLRGGWDIDLENVEITNVRYIANINNIS